MLPPINTSTITSRPDPVKCREASKKVGQLLEKNKVDMQSLLVLSADSLCEIGKPLESARIILEAVSALSEKYPESENYRKLKKGYEFLYQIENKKSKCLDVFNNARQSLKEGEYVPFAVYFGSHISVCSIENSAEMKYKFNVYNSGNGASKHHYLNVAKDAEERNIEVQYALEIPILSKNEFPSKLFLGELIKGGKDIKLLYEKYLIQAGHLKEKSDNTRLWSKGQNGNCCFGYSLLLLAKAKLTREEYLELKLALREAIFPVYSARQGEIKDPIVRKIISLEMIRKIEKGYKKLHWAKDPFYENKRKAIEAELRESETVPKDVSSLSINDSLSKILKAFQDHHLATARVYIEGLYTKLPKSKKNYVFGPKEIEMVLSMKKKLLEFCKNVSNLNGNVLYTLPEAQDLFAGLIHIISQSEASKDVNEKQEWEFIDFKNELIKTAGNTKILRFCLHKYQSKPGHDSPWKNELPNSVLYSHIYDRLNRKFLGAMDLYIKKFSDSKGKNTCKYSHIPTA